MDIFMFLKNVLFFPINFNATYLVITIVILVITTRLNNSSIISRKYYCNVLYTLTSQEKFLVALLSSLSNCPTETKLVISTQPLLISV